MSRFTEPSGDMAEYMEVHVRRGEGPGGREFQTVSGLDPANKSAPEALKNMDRESVQSPLSELLQHLLCVFVFGIQFQGPPVAADSKM